ncbi:hypothetical protein J6590_025509 [Homalodisca vitripennis]|nr:hypothetical protein J6590_027524 [Homalodisca vitripennis]KAG8278190.1 hypothetical protein J6590_025509 [Homalodisca vitripennis]
MTRSAVPFVRFALQHHFITAQCIARLPQDLLGWVSAERICLPGHWLGSVRKGFLALTSFEDFTSLIIHFSSQPLPSHLIYNWLEVLPLACTQSGIDCRLRLYRQLVPVLRLPP